MIILIIRVICLRLSNAIFGSNFGGKMFLFVCVEVLRPKQQLRSCRAGQLPINTVSGQANKQSLNKANISDAEAPFLD